MTTVDIAMAEVVENKTLFVFDFDHTLIEENSDTFILSLCPELLEQLQTSRRAYGSWTNFMNHAFSLIHGQGRTKEEILDHMKKIRFYEQALKSVNAIHESRTADCIIISDSNTIFIDTTLEECGAKGFFSAIFSNPAHFDVNGRLHVQAYHSHSCERCEHAPNLCKGRVLEEYRRLHTDYDRVVYVGDGRNDYCPCLTLTQKDVVICREGYALAKLLKQPTSCRARVNTIDFVSSLGDFIVSNLL